jgi:WD40 repeat protein
MVNKQPPYVGPRPYEKEDEILFFGRSQEISDLSSLIVAHGEVLVYAQSGAGKTSLLNAGVIPQLDKKGFEILPIARTRGLIPESIKPEEIANLYIFNALISWVETGEDPYLLTQTTLSDYLKDRKRPTDEYGQPLPRVIIFDQFEELLSFYPERWADREGFFEQIHDGLEEDSLLRVVFVIREDYLAQLDPYTHLLPEKLHTRFRLERMDKEAALSAAIEPLKGTGLSYAEGVAEKLVDELLQVRVETATGKFEIITGDLIEPVQLQVVCQDLWQQLPAGITEITYEHLEALGDANQALSRFYERSIMRAAQETPVSEGDLREWFEHSLITPAGTRGTVFQGRDRSGGIPNATVRVLEDLHLIRGEWRAGARWYELTHDRFVEPVQESNRQWLTGKWEAEQARKRLEAKAMEWIDMGRGRGGLLDEFELHDAQRWLESIKTADLDLSEDVSNLIELSRSAIEEAEREKETARRRELEQAQALAKTEAARASDAERSSLRFKQFSITLGVFLAVAVAALGMATWQYILAKEKQEKLAVRAYTAAAYGNLERDPDRSVLFALLSLSGARAMHDDNSSRPSEDALHRALQSQHLVYSIKEAHDGPVSTVAYSPDGLRLVTGGRDGGIKIWDAYTGKELHKFFYPPVTALSLEYEVAHNGGALVRKVMAGGAADQAGIKRFDRIMKIGEKPVTENEPLPRLLNEFPVGSRLMIELIRNGQTITIETVLGKRNPGIYSSAFSSNGKWIVTAGESSKITLWDADSYQKIKAIDVNAGGIWKVAFNKDGTRIVTLDEKGNAKIWDVDTGQEFCLLKGHKKRINNLAFSPDGTRIATASDDNTGKLWSAESCKELSTLTGHDRPLSALAFSPDGKHIITGSTNWMIGIWDTNTGKPIRFSPSGHTHLVNGLAFSSDGHYFSSASQDGKVKVWGWDAETGTAQELYSLTGHGGGLLALTFSPDGGHLATTSQKGMLETYEFLPREAVTLSGNQDFLWGLAYSPDGKSIATAGDDGTVILWDADSGYVLNRFIGHGKGVSGVAFDKDGSHIATASMDNTAKVWGIAANKELLTLKGHKDWVNGVAYSHDGKRIATASRDKTVKIWNAESGRELLMLAEQESPIKGVVFSPDDGHIATAGLDKTVRIWDSASGRELLILDHPDEVWAVAFSPDGKQVASASRNGEVSLWDAVSGQEIRTMTGHNGWILGLAYNQDGTQIASASTDKTVRIWDVKTGEQLHNFARHPSELTGVAFSPDGKHLASVSADGMARIYEMDAEDLLTLGLTRVNNSLSEEDCDKYLNQKPCPPMIVAVDKIVKGKSLAKEGDLDGALKSLQEARRLDSNLPSGLEKEFKRLSAPHLLFEGNNLAKEDKLSEAIADFQAARIRDPLLEIRADYWNTLCWWSSLAGKAAEVMEICDKAVDLSHGYGMYRDTRGVARALAGDAKGAIDDFEAYLKQSYENPQIEQLKFKRRQWVEVLRKGDNPITPAEIKELLKEGG